MSYFTPPHVANYAAGSGAFLAAAAIISNPPYATRQDERGHMKRVIRCVLIAGIVGFSIWFAVYWQNVLGMRKHANRARR